jgi:hypothetical protein
MKGSGFAGLPWRAAALSGCCEPSFVVELVMDSASTCCQRHCPPQRRLKAQHMGYHCCGSLEGAERIDLVLPLINLRFPT